ncbi:MAG: hypothetical protein ACYC2H_09930 [Thermoplasmatota archaeon]
MAIKSYSSEGRQFMQDTATGKWATFGTAYMEPVDFLWYLFSSSAPGRVYARDHGIPLSIGYDVPVQYRNALLPPVESWMRPILDAIGQGGAAPPRDPLVDPFSGLRYANVAAAQANAVLTGQPDPVAEAANAAPQREAMLEGPSGAIGVGQLASWLLVALIVWLVFRRLA